MKPLDDMLIREMRGNVLIFDRATANNIAMYLLGRDVDQNGRERNLTQDELEMIAERLITQSEVALSLAVGNRVGKNTIVYNATRDFTPRDGPVDVSSVRQGVYIVVPSGATIHGKRYADGKVVEIPVAGSQEFALERFLSSLRMLNYKRKEAVEIAAHLYGQHLLSLERNGYPIKTNISPATTQTSATTPDARYSR